MLSTEKEAELHQFFLTFACSHGQQNQYIETHISKVYIGREKVWKRKKPISMPFLDYSTLAKRRIACQDEIVLNRRLAPDTYLCVLALCYDQDIGLYTKPLEDLNASEVIRDYAVEMKRLPEELMLDHYLMGGQSLDDIQKQQLINLLIRFYQQQRGQKPDYADWFARLCEHTKANLQELIEAPLASGLSQRLRILLQRQLLFLATKQSQFYRRWSEGWICDGHGDLKPEHICLLEPPAIYDCVEFDQNYRLNDVIDELSFLAMELSMLGQEALADELLSGVTERLDCDPSLSGFFQCYRACVRAKVEQIKAQSVSGNEAPQANSLASSSQEYLAMAEKKVMPLGQPVLLAVGGLMGSGKSTVAKYLADELAVSLLRTDAIRQSQGKARQEASSTAGFNQGRYSSANRNAVYQMMFEQARAAIEDGESCMMDASFTSLSNRQELYQMAAELGVPVFLFWVHCPDEVAKERIARRLREQDDPSEAMPELYDQQKNHCDPIGEDEPLVWLNSDQPIPDMLTTAYHQLGDQAAMALRE